MQINISLSNSPQRATHDDIVLFVYALSSSCESYKSGDALSPSGHGRGPRKTQRWAGVWGLYLRNWVTQYWR